MKDTLQTAKAIVRVWSYVKPDGSFCYARCIDGPKGTHWLFSEPPLLRPADMEYGRYWCTRIPILPGEQVYVQVILRGKVHACYACNADVVSLWAPSNCQSADECPVCQRLAELEAEQDA